LTRLFSASEFAKKHDFQISQGNVEALFR